MFRECTWHRSPPVFQIDDGTLTVITGEETDFWRVTEYNFIHDNGHFFSKPVDHAFTAQLHVRANFHVLYDQAGIMVRIDERHWIKIGAEFSDGQLMMSTVLTNEKSDWAVTPVPAASADFWIRVTVRSGSVRAQYSVNGVDWPLLRLAPFPLADSYLVGPMCCSPQRAGLEVHFSEFSIQPALQKDLHDLS
jgi:regulation of enolase protein 1 (concanavalin A-like superfamily)